MLANNMTNKEIQEALSLLDTILIQHQQWFNDLIRTIACKLPYVEKECSLKAFTDHLNLTHQELHEKAKNLFKNNKDISPEKFDEFLSSLEKFKTAIYTYKDELRMSLQNHDHAATTATRVTMLPILREQQTYAKRQSQTCCIAMIEIDLLEKIKDQFGDTTQDTILVTLAQFLVDHVRAYDRVFCYSHHAFIVSLQQVGAEQALELIDRLRIKISKTPINIGLPEPLYITVSCGITTLDTLFTVEQSLEQANLALYLAKTSGYNNTKLWGG